MLDTGPLWLTGRVAQYGQLLFDDDPPRREPVDERWLDAVKYTLVTAIGGCGRVAHHLVVSEGWPIAESNADAIRELASQGVVPRPVVEPVATAVGLRNVLVHQYADVERSPAGHERAGRSPRPR